MAGHGGSSWQQRVVARLKAEPKRAAFLAVLVAVMGLMWAKALSRGGMAPAAASGSIDSAAYAAPVAGPVGPQLSRSSQALQDWIRSPLPPTQRNVFEIKLDYYPRDLQTPGPGGAEDDGFWDQVGKSLPSRADQEKARRILAENLQAQASRLDLQSTVMSQGSPKALIGGVLVEEGDVVSGFRILKIEARRIIVEREGVKLEVLFKFR